MSGPEPWAATLEGVAALIPDWKIPAALTPGQTGLTAVQVEGWLAELSGIVSLRLAGWDGLPADRSEPLVRAGRDAIQNGAASYVEAARHPDRAGKGATSYSDVLWSRFTERLDNLAELLAVWLEDPAVAVDGPTSAAPAFAFPDAAILDSLRF